MGEREKKTIYRQHLSSSPHIMRKIQLRTDLCEALSGKILPKNIQRCITLHYFFCCCNSAHTVGVEKACILRVCLFFLILFFLFDEACANLHTHTQKKMYRCTLSYTQFSIVSKSEGTPSVQEGRYFPSLVGLVC